MRVNPQKLRFRSFNPLPAVKPGDTVVLLNHATCVSVSIRSQRLSREIRIFCGYVRLQFFVSIRSQRLSREILHKVILIHPLTGFNPLTAVKPGDTDEFLNRTRKPHSFNPLPAVKPGDTTIPGIAAQAMMFQSAPSG